MRQSLMLVSLLWFALCTPALAQSGPWAKFDAKIKGDALVRDADGGYLGEVKSIVEGGGDVNWTLPTTGLTPLMAAAAGGHADVVAFLLEQGADPSARDLQGKTALDRARAGGFAAVVARLQGATQGRPEPAPARPPTPGPQTKPAPVAAPAPGPAAGAGRLAPAGATGPSQGGWPAFGSYAVGERVQWRQSNGWFSGTVSEVGVPGPTAGRAEVYERKYRVTDDRWSGAGEWWDWGAVAGLQREPFWTLFFVGEWALGEVMAVNDRIEGAEVRTEYAFHTASEALRVAADGSYRWKPLGAAEIRGRWAPATDGPGIVLKSGADGVDWTLRNETNATEENIRGLQTARLSAEGRMSIAAKRPMR